MADNECLANAADDVELLLCELEGGVDDDVALLQGESCSWKRHE